MPLDITAFRAFAGGDPERIRESQRRRHKPVEVVDEIVALDEQWRLLTGEIDNLKKARNAVQKDVGAKKKAGEECEAQLAEIRALDEAVSGKEAEQRERKVALDRLVSKVGNIVHDSVPVGVDEDKDNRVERTWGTPRASAGLLNHAELLWCIGGYEPDKGVAVAGHRGYFLRDAGVLLNQAFINYGIDFLRKRSYSVLQPPYMMRREVMAGVAQLEQFDEELYGVGGSGAEGDMYMIATSEQPICAFHKDEWLEEKALPLRYAGVSTCFRKEAGSHGKDNWGIFRVHQFEKIEQFAICEGDLDASEALQQEMIATAEAFYQSLGFPYQVICIVSGALNNAAIKKYDLEAWFPGYEAYRELVSCSNCTDYQSRAMEIRCGIKKLGDKEKRYVHMLNSTLCATGRAICCLLETYQEADGVRVPEALVPYMGGATFLPFVRELRGALRDASKKPAVAPKVAVAPQESAPTPAPSQPPAESLGSPEAVALAELVAEAAAGVRSLKEAGADKGAVKEAVDALLALKTRLAALEAPPAKQSAPAPKSTSAPPKTAAPPKTLAVPAPKAAAGSVWSVEGAVVDLAALDATLAALSYVGGYCPSAADRAVLAALGKARVQEEELGTHAQRWLRHVQSFEPWERAAWK